jgi:hypothetical protein
LNHRRYGEESNHVRIWKKSKGEGFCIGDSFGFFVLDSRLQTTTRLGLGWAGTGNVGQKVGQAGNKERKEGRGSGPVGSAGNKKRGVLGWPEIMAQEAWRERKMLFYFKTFYKL